MITKATTWRKVFEIKIGDVVNTCDEGGNNQWVSVIDVIHHETAGLWVFHWRNINDDVFGTSMYTGGNGVIECRG